MSQATNESQAWRSRIPSPGRILLVGLVVVALVLSFCWWQSRSGIRSVETRGARFGRDWGWGSSGPWTSLAGWWTLGNDGLSRALPDGAVSYLTVAGKQFDDQWTNHLDRFAGLQSFSLYGTSMTDKSLKVIGEGQFQLVSFGVLDGATITDTGVAHLAKQPKLFWLQIDNQPKITGRFLNSFSSPPLTNLNLRRCRGVTDEGLSELHRFNGLQQLNLSGTSITDATLRKVATLPHLRDLWLNDTNVTPQGIEWLKRKFPRLQIDHESLYQKDQLEMF